MSAGGAAGTGRLRTDLRAFARSWQLAWRPAPLTLLCRALLCLAMGTVPVAVAWLMKLLLDGLAGGGSATRAVGLAAVGITLLGLVTAVLPEIQRYVNAEAHRTSTLAGRSRLYAALGRLVGLSRYEDPRFHDRIEVAASSGPDTPDRIVSSALGVGQALVGLVGFIVTLALFSPLMIVVVLLAALPAVRAELGLSRHRAQLMLRLSPAARRELFYSNLLMHPAAAKEIRMFGLGGLFADRMVTELGAINRENRRMDRRELRAQGALAALGAVVTGAGLIWAVVQAQAGQLTLGDVSIFVAAVAGVQYGLRLVINDVREGYTALLLFDTYLEVVDAGPDLPVPAVDRPVAALVTGIEVRDVWFRYSDAHPWVLRGVSCTIAANRSTALVGLNGAGKSTLVKLLCRFYDPTRGSIRWDGVDLRDLPVAELRRRIGVVFQDFMEYELTARENIGVGDLARMGDHDEIVRVARLASCHHTITALGRGYDTPLTRIFGGPDPDDPHAGTVLSGGQWQRVALARGLLRGDRDLLILDEPSSGLDAQAEHEVHRMLRERRAGRASVLISHRLNAVRDADVIVVLADGVVVERGTHECLMAADGPYAGLFTRQASGYQLGTVTETTPCAGRWWWH